MLSVEGTTWLEYRNIRPGKWELQKYSLKERRRISKYTHEVSKPNDISKSTLQSLSYTLEN